MNPTKCQNCGASLPAGIGGSEPTCPCCFERGRRITNIPITFPEQEPEPETVDIIREHDRKIIGFIENVLHILNAYQEHQVSRVDLSNRSVKRLRMSCRAMALALGYPLAAGADGPAELARKCGLSKQTVGKCLNHFIAQLRLGPLPGQRDDKARENMAKARRRQVTPKRENDLESL